MKRKILLIYTGGTIGMMRNSETNVLQPFPFHDIYSHLPVLSLVNAEIVYREITPLIDSSDTSPAFWIKLAKYIYSNYEKADGFVILHGTDTMAYTASALSFLLENLDKPVILTGSQLPLGVIRTDGRKNILSAVEIAANCKNGLPSVPEVCIYFENKLLRGNRSYKHNTEQFNAFTSSNYPVLAKVGVKIQYNSRFIHKPDNLKLKLHTKVDDNVAILKLYPGITNQLISAIIYTKGLRAIVMETYGTGNAPTNKKFLHLLKTAIDNGIIILNVTQCRGGGVESGLYETNSSLNKIGVISGYDITTEAAVTKLMYLMGEFKDNKIVKKYLAISLIGEMMTANTITD